MDNGFYCGFEEEVPDDFTDEQCDDVALTMIARARTIVEPKVDEQIELIKGVKIFKHIT